MTFIYKLDPRTKLLFVFLFTLLVFLINKLFVAIILVLFVIIFRITVKIPFTGIKYFRNLALLAFFIMIMQILLVPGENFILKPLIPFFIPVFGGMGSLKWEGLMLGLLIVCRITALIVVFPVFTESTSPYSLAVGLNSLGLNYRAAFIVTYCFNLIPKFREEANVIMDAQKLRGMRSFDEGSLFAKLKAYSRLAIPLVLGAMRKAQISSIAMDVRAFGVYEKRAWLFKPEMKTYDFLFISCTVLVFACLLFFNYHGI